MRCQRSVRQGPSGTWCPGALGVLIQPCLTLRSFNVWDFIKEILNTFNACFYRDVGVQAFDIHSEEEGV